MKNIIIRTIVVLMFFMLLQPFFINTVEVKAFGVVGSNALKSVVMGAQERAGIQYASKTAKEKAFDAWNMKAYERWLEAERTGKNKELWDEWNKIHSNPEQYIKIEPVPDKPGLGRVLLDTTIYGMAIGIGAEVGYAIDKAQKEEAMMRYMTDDYIPKWEGYDLSRMYGITKTWEPTGNYWHPYALHVRKGTWEIVSPATPLDGPDPRVDFHLKSVVIPEPGTSGSPYIIFDYSGVDSEGVPWVKRNNKRTIPEDIEMIPSNIGTLYDLKPSPEDVPNIIPNPHLEPLITPNPDLSKIPEVIPPGVIEVLVPLDPDDDPFWEGVINEPHDSPIPDPGTDPGTNPGTDPGTDPGNLPAPEPIPDPFPEPTKEVKPEELSCERVKRPDFDQLGNAFSNAFPFSLPFDIHRFFKASFENIDDKKPEFELSFLGEGVILTIPDEFDVLVKYLKGFILIMFDISLLYLFARFMRKGTD